jgi:hypothetical protein
MIVEIFSIWAVQGTCCLPQMSIEYLEYTLKDWGIYSLILISLNFSLFLSLFLFFLLLWNRALYLLGKCVPFEPEPQSYFALVILSDRVSHFCPRAGLRLQTFYSVSHMQGLHHHVHLFFEIESYYLFLWDWPQTVIFPSMPPKLLGL